MEEHQKKNAGKRKATEQDEVICSNELLAMIREQMAKKRQGAKDQQPKELRIEPVE